MRRQPKLNDPTALRLNAGQEYTSPEAVLLLLAADSPLLAKSQSERYSEEPGRW